MEYLQLDHQAVLSLLPDRLADTHKGNYGKLLLLCGSKGYTGAAALAAMGALRSGAGLVFLTVPECIYEIEAIKLTEPIVQAIPSKNGMFSSVALDSIRKMFTGKDVLLIGPGIGRSQDTEAVVCFALEHFAGPVILDADGINVISEHKDLLRGRTHPTILTPHDGEFLRLGGKLSEDRIQSATAFAREFGIILLLKGHRTIITDGVKCYINTTGNPGMATGGSGDVLAGVITALVGQGIPPLEAAACGAWLHGAAGVICAQEIGQYGMLPTDMINVLPRLLK